MHISSAAISRPPAQSNAIETTEARESAVATRGLTFNPDPLWRETWHTLIAQPLPMLIFVLINFIGFLIIAAVVRTAPRFNLTLVPIFAGMLIQAFAFGGITWLALQHHPKTASIAMTYRAVFQRLPTLLLSSLIYGISITAVSSMLGLAHQDLRREARILFAPPISKGLDTRLANFVINAAESLVVQSINTLNPDPGLPFSVWLPDLRGGAFMHNVSFSNTIQIQSVTEFVPMYAPKHWEYWLIVFGSLGLIVAVETMLRLRTVMILATDCRALISPFINSIHLGIKYFGVITAHLWLLRWVFFIFSLVFIIMPIAMVQEVLLPSLMKIEPNLQSALPVYSISSRAVQLSIGLINALHYAFTITYDVQLYKSLKPKTCHFQHPKLET